MIFSKGIKYTFLNGFVILIRAFSTVIINKLTVLFLGTSGLLFLGNLKNIYSILQQISGAGVYEGIVKYTSGEYKNRISYVLQSGFLLMLIGLAIAVLLYGVFSYKIFTILSINSLDKSFKIWISLGVVFSLICFILHLLLQAYFHGRMKFHTLVVTSAISSVINILISVSLIYFFGKAGIIASVLLPSVIMLSTYLFYSDGLIHFFRKPFLKQFDSFLIKPLFSYTLMSALAAVVFPSVFIYIRSYLTTNIGLNMAAYWEGYSKLSLFISGLAISSISLYYLPKLTRASSALEIRQVVFWGLKFMILFGFPFLMLLFIFGNTLIPLLYNDDFLHTFFLLKWELLGTFFKLLSFTVSFLMVAKKMTKMFVFSELISGLIFLILSLVFIRYTGVEGASIAYATTYLLYFVWTLIYFNGKFKFFSKN